MVSWKNHGRFKTKAVKSIDHTPTDTTNTSTTITTTDNTLSTTDATEPNQQPDSTTGMSIDTPEPSTLAPLPPTISLSRPFNPPQPTLLPALAANSTPTLTPILLPSATPASRPLNGRQWRNPTQPPHRSLTTAHSKAWGRRQAERQQRVALRAKVGEMEKLAVEVRVEEKRKREQRAKVKAENEKKNRIVQVIKDSSKIKRMSRAQLKLIEKA